MRVIHTISATIKKKKLKVIKYKELTSQCFQVVLAERYHLLKDMLDSAIQESFQAACGDINANQGLPEVSSCEQDFI